MTLEFEAWRCAGAIDKFCPDEGCPKGFCARRDAAWEPGKPTPDQCANQTANIGVLSEAAERHFQSDR